MVNVSRNVRKTVERTWIEILLEEGLIDLEWSTHEVIIFMEQIVTIAAEKETFFCVNPELSEVIKM